MSGELCRRRLLQLAAADPSGDPPLVWRAAGRLGIPVQAAAGLAEFGAQAPFRHPLVRSAAYRSASIPDRQQMHAARAEVTDPRTDPDRRDPARHVERALAATQASLQAGAIGKAMEMLSMAEASGSASLDEFANARADLLRGQIAFASSVGSDAPALLVLAAKRLEPLDATLARQTYLEARAAACHAGRLAGACSIREVAQAARSAPPPRRHTPASDLLLDGLAVLMTEGRAAAPC